MKCYNIHGHTYLYELTFGFGRVENIGYAIDFKEIKRIACQWIDDKLDHAAILNPQDTKCIELCMKLNSKLWLMSLNETEYCNPTVENIAKEVFLAMQLLAVKMAKGLNIHHVRIYETPNCYCDTTNVSISSEERNNFFLMNKEKINKYAEERGSMQYDDRKIVKQAIEEITPPEE